MQNEADSFLMFTFSVPPTARSWAEISSHALTHNLALVRKCVGPRVEILAVVKANGCDAGFGQDPDGDRLAVAGQTFGLTQHRLMLAVSDRPFVRASEAPPDFRVTTVPKEARTVRAVWTLNLECK